MPKPILASDFAKIHNTSTDVIISLIKDKRIPAVSGKDRKWYIPPNTSFKIYPYECRLIHLSNQIKKVFEANRITLRATKIKRYSTIFDEYIAANSDADLCYNPVKREVYISKYPDTSDYNITKMLKGEEIEITKESVYKRIVLLINQRLYNSYIVVVPRISKYATKGTLNEAIETAKILSQRNGCGVKIYYKAKKVYTYDCEA